MEEDERFAHIAWDPRFKKVPQKHRKVKIDQRFHQMFSDKEFNTKNFVDARGRKKGHSAKVDLQHFYQLSDEELADEENHNKEKFKISEIDYARGEGDVVSSSSEDEVEEEDHVRRDDKSARRNSKSTKGSKDKASIIDAVNEDDEKDEQSSDEESEEDAEDDSDYEEETVDVNEEELQRPSDEQVPLVEDATNRLAVCNMNWDKVDAQDLLVLFSSFKPAEGIINSVKIYPSEFGLQRMKTEEVLGPVELQEEDLSTTEEAVEGSEFSMEKLRQYQLNRLKYFYAVIDCDSAETANTIYEECDGLEYEQSASTLDLRFIPDGTVFDQEPQSVATELKTLNSYKPPEFTTTALQQSRVKLTWDETDEKRLKTTMRKFSKDDLLEMDFSAYLASSSESEEENENEVEKEDNLDEDGRIEKYKSLIKDIKKKEEDEANKGDMEISWEPGLREVTEGLVQKKTEDKEKLTPWEKYQKERKQKKKERRNKANGRKATEEPAEPDGSVEEDDDIPLDVDLNDPYFQEEFGSDLTQGKNNSKRKMTKKKRKGGNKTEETPEEKKRKEELELLLMDDEEDKQHFSLKQILDNEKKGKNKRKRKDKEEGLKQEDFNIDLQDNRFEALFSSHHYAVDPSNPQFKKTKAMDAIISEKQKRNRNRGAVESAISNPQTKTMQASESKKTVDPSLSLLVKSVKSKAEAHQEKKKRKR